MKRFFSLTILFVVLRAFGQATNDETAALQARIDLLRYNPGWGGEVVLEPRTYHVTGLKIPQRATLRGLGWATKLQRTPGTTEPVVILECPGDYCHWACLKDLDVDSAGGGIAVKIIFPGEHSGLWSVNVEGGPVVVEGIASTLHLEDLTLFYTGDFGLVLRCTPLDTNMPAWWGGYNSGQVDISGLKADGQDLAVIAMNGNNRVLIEGFGTEQTVAPMASKALVWIADDPLNLQPGTNRLAKGSVAVSGPRYAPSYPYVEIHGGSWNCYQGASAKPTLVKVDAADQHATLVITGWQVGLGLLVDAPGLKLPAVGGSPSLQVQDGHGELKF